MILYSIQRLKKASKIKNIIGSLIANFHYFSDAIIYGDCHINTTNFGRVSKILLYIHMLAEIINKQIHA